MVRRPRGPAHGSSLASLSPSRLFEATRAATPLLLSVHSRECGLTKWSSAASVASPLQRRVRLRWGGWNVWLYECSMPGFPIDRRQGMGPSRGALVGLSREACNRAPLWWAPRGAMARARMAQACTGGTGQCGKPERFRCAVAPCHVEDGGVGQWEARRAQRWSIRRSDQGSTALRQWVGATLKTDERESRGEAQGPPERGAPSLVAA